MQHVGNHGAHKQRMRCSDQASSLDTQSMKGLFFFFVAMIANRLCPPNCGVPDPRGVKVPNDHVALRLRVEHTPSVHPRLPPRFVLDECCSTFVQDVLLSPSFLLVLKQRLSGQRSGVVEFTRVVTTVVVVVVMISAGW